eukprot:CAMPEP_0197887348 /NCGR_PEP_ID=MMETSP1439-20131203/19381_1 /TAXON_ID=66791 /ORGANISM="Gonyaulax spinifera, Strain CCMP409" /LENGTH=269 /DNA_ID=CAMNT_0043507191 /DNA_START=62 /DNA_END=871 /DNA_ORIENTATION=+
MVKSCQSAACAVAAGAACSFAGSAAFSVVSGATASSGTPQRSLRSAGPAPSQAPSGWAPASAVASLAVGAAAVAASRRRTACHSTPFGQQQQLSGGFANGLVGSEYAGWGKYQFDPAELSSRYPEQLPWFREAELKHGRVAMLACVGLIAPDAVRLPADVFQQTDLDIVNAHSKLIGPGFGEGPMWWLLVFCGAIESIRFKQLGLGFEKLTLETAGDIGFGKAFLPKTEEGIKQMQIKELKNGRLAMLAFSGAITQAVAFDAHHFPFVN